MKRKVLLLGDPALYEVSSAVTREELEELRPDIEDMFECLKDAGFGHGISAPQIGIKKRLICLDLDGVRRGMCAAERDQYSLTCSSPLRTRRAAWARASSSSSPG